MFKAIADPTRRAILDHLADGQEMSVSELVERFDISQPAVSQQLKVLFGAGLVTVRKVGRKRMYRIDAAGLREVYDWVARYEKFWDEKLDRLGQYLDETYPDQKIDPEP